MAPRKKHIPKEQHKPRGAKPISFDYGAVEKLASQGLTQEQVALSLGVSARTVTDRLSNDAKFADAYKKGEATGILQVSNMLFQEAMTPGKVGTTARIFYLKTRAKWTERVELTGKDGEPLNKALTPEQMLEQAKTMLEEAEHAGNAVSPKRQP